MNHKRANIEVIAPSLEEAIARGLKDLGLPEEAVEIEVLDEGSKGLFGIGVRQARIRLTVKSAAQETGSETSPSEKQPDLPGKPVLSSKDEALLNTARETVSDLLKKMNVKARVTAEFGEIDEEDQRRPPLYIDIHGNDLSILIGRKAETLNALQFITRLILGKEMERSIPIIVDVEGYRKRRIQQIRQLAQRVADQVAETGRSQALEPMPPNERRIVHIELRRDPSVFTESTGEGESRKVVIHPKR
jgi:spoIIIJ-associated protein